MMRIEALQKLILRRHLDEVVIHDEADIYALTGVRCDNAVLTKDVFYTDFRYVAAVRRVAPELRVRDIKKIELPRGRDVRIGYESAISKAYFDTLVKLSPKAKFVDIYKDLCAIRAVKTPAELEKLKAAESLNCAIWLAASKQFTAGMTEKDMARIIQRMMVEQGDGEAFETIVCVGKNAAECHHEPDDTKWNGKEPILVDMGVKLNGVCSDLTRNLVPKRVSLAYRKAYEIVKIAHDAAIAAARPGMTAAQLDWVARKIIKDNGFGKCFGHSLGHGVGYEIHEAPTISKKNRDMKLKPGMVITIEPGIYLEGNFGIRIEDMVVITENGCEMIHPC